MKYKALIFDIDNTLVNTLDMNMIPLQKIILEEKGEEWTLEEVYHFASYPGMKVMEELEVKNPEEVYARWVKYVNEYKASPYDGMDNVLKTLHEKLRFSVVSSKNKKQYDIDVVSLGLDDYMEVVVLEDDTSKHKPDPEPLLLCMERLGLNKEDVIYIGDAYSNLLASRNAGIDFAFAKWGSVESKDMNDSDYILEKVEDLLRLL